MFSCFFAQCLSGDNQQGAVRTPRFLLICQKKKTDMRMRVCDRKRVSEGDSITQRRVRVSGLCFSVRENPACPWQRREVQVMHRACSVRSRDCARAVLLSNRPWRSSCPQRGGLVRCWQWSLSCWSDPNVSPTASPYLHLEKPHIWKIIVFLPGRHSHSTVK